MKKIIFILITLFVFSFSQRIYASNSGVFSDGKTIKNLKKDNKFKKTNKPNNIKTNIKNLLHLINKT